MTNTNSTEQLTRLLQIMETLRAPGGCPWDREQTPESLKPYILEEAYEVIEAIDTGDSNEICDELGDLLLQVVFLAQIFNEREIFSFAEVADSISSKLVRRHPHVFAAADANDHAQRWEAIKQQERQQRGKGNKLVDKIPKHLPALKKATKVIKKTDLQNSETLISQIEARTAKIKQLFSKNNSQLLEFELGEILFDLVQLASSHQLDAEEILRKKTMKVIAESDKELLPPEVINFERVEK